MGRPARDHPILPIYYNNLQAGLGRYLRYLMDITIDEVNITKPHVACIPKEIRNGFFMAIKFQLMKVCR